MVVNIVGLLCCINCVDYCGGEHSWIIVLHQLCGNILRTILVSTVTLLYKVTIMEQLDV